MGKHVRISDIAKLAGVSAGTVDRIIHNRGNVSKLKREAVERVLSEVGYEPNMHLSSISMSKRYEIAIVLPEYNKGGFWDDIHKGFMRVVDEYANIDIHCTLHVYNQYDVYSSIKVHEKILAALPDAVIIGPTFHVESLLFTRELDARKCPYVFVDSYIDGSNPVSYYIAHQQSIGALMGKLISQVTADDSEFLHLREERLGDQSANNTVLRKVGLLNYLDGIGKAKSVHSISFSVNGEDDDQGVKDFFAAHPNIKGAVVLSSKGSIVSNLFKRCGITDVRLICADLTEANAEAIRQGEIDYVVCQYPQQQGYLALKNIMHYLLFGVCENNNHYMPITLVTKESIDFYREI